VPATPSSTKQETQMVWQLFLTSSSTALPLSTLDSHGPLEGAVDIESVQPAVTEVSASGEVRSTDEARTGSHNGREDENERACVKTLSISIAPLTSNPSLAYKMLLSRQCPAHYNLVQSSASESGD